MVEMTRKEVQTDRRRFGMRSKKFTSPQCKTRLGVGAAKLKQQTALIIFSCKFV